MTGAVLRFKAGAGASRLPATPAEGFVSLSHGGFQCSIQNPTIGLGDVEFDGGFTIRCSGSLAKRDSGRGLGNDSGRKHRVAYPP